MIGRKIAHAIAEGLNVIVCIGNFAVQTSCGSGNDDVDAIFEQCQAVADVITDWQNIVLAYEPFISDDNSSADDDDDVSLTAERVQAVHGLVRQWLVDFVSPASSASVRIIYGGPVTKCTCKVLALQPDIDGFLIDWNSATIGADLVDILNAKL